MDERLGLIGVGTMGLGHVRSFLGFPDVQVVAVCDVVAERRDNAKKVVDAHYTKQAKGTNSDCKAYNDFRDLLARTDIDAVVIATPDHWHAIQMIAACQAGKEIYVEKPLSMTIVEGRAMVDAARKTDRIVQVGTHRRPSRLYAQLAGAVRSR